MTCCYLPVADIEAIQTIGCIAIEVKIRKTRGESELVTYIRSIISDWATEKRTKN